MTTPQRKSDREELAKMIGGLVAAVVLPVGVFAIVWFWRVLIWAWESAWVWP